MRKSGLVALALISLLGGVANAAPPTLGELAERAVEQVFRPGFADYADVTGALGGTVGALCADPGSETLEAARQGFAATVDAWSRIELYRVGPLLADNRSDRTLFWPDRKGIALKQVQQILGSADETATDAATLAGKSVAVQGLGALEYLLWGTGAETLTSAAGDFRCRYAAAVAGNLAGIAGEMSAEWAAEDGIAYRLTHPSAEDPDYRNTREVAETLTGLMAHGVELIRDQRLLPFIGRDGAEPKPKSALFWRSGLTASSVRGDFDGLKRLFELSGIAEAGGPDNAWVFNTGDFEFRNAERAGGVITASVEAALADARQKKAYEYLVIVTQSLSTILGENLPASLALSVGFSTLDGD